MRGHRLARSSLEISCIAQEIAYAAFVCEIQMSNFAVQMMLFLLCKKCQKFASLKFVPIATHTLFSKQV